MSDHQKKCKNNGTNRPGLLQGRFEIGEASKIIIIRFVVSIRFLREININQASFFSKDHF